MKTKEDLIKEIEDCKKKIKENRHLLKKSFKKRESKSKSQLTSEIFEYVTNGYTIRQACKLTGITSSYLYSFLDENQKLELTVLKRTCQLK